MQLLAQSRGYDFYNFGAMIGGMSDFLLLALLSISAWVGAVITARDTQSDEFLLQRISPLTARDAVRGYFDAVMISLRLPLAILAAWVPAMVVAGFDMVIDDGLGIHQAITGLQAVFPADLSGQIWQALITGGLAQLLAGVGLFGAVVFGAALGVWMGLLWRRTTPATALAMLPGLASLVAVPMLLMAGIWQWPLLNPLDGYILALNTCWLLIPATLWLAEVAYERSGSSVSPER